MNRVLPEWLRPLAQAAGKLRAADLSRLEVPERGGRASAVLVLFGEGPGGPDVLLTQRSAQVRDHAAQPAFPGGAADPGDDGPAATALREAAEETGLDDTGVEVFAVLPALWLPPSGFLVTPVLGWWHTPCAVTAVDPAEVAAVARLPVSVLVDPANRFRLRHPSGYVGPAFEVGGMLVWGFTAGLLDRLLEVAGWARPWPHDDVRSLPVA